MGIFNFKFDLCNNHIIYCLFFQNFMTNDQIDTANSEFLIILLLFLIAHFLLGIGFKLAIK